MKQFLASILLLSSMTLAACSTQEVVEYRYIYSDGSGNAYRISESQIEYDPVKPLESSSGVYDGGEAVTKEISAEQFADLQEVIEAAVGNTDAHIEARQMMSGQISVVDGEERSTVILAPGSEGKEAVEVLLLRLLE